MISQQLRVFSRHGFPQELGPQDGQGDDQFGQSLDVAESRIPGLFLKSADMSYNIGSILIPVTMDDDG